MTRTSAHVAQPTPASPPPLQADFAQLYETYFDFVWASARRLGVGAAHIDDAVQDVFLAVFRRLPEFRGDASFKTWLFHFVLRVASTYRRAALVTERKREPDGVTLAPAPSPPDALVEGRQATELMYRLLGEVPEAPRAVFILVELDGLSVAEAADALGLNRNTAHSRLGDARRSYEQAVARERAREDWRTR